MSAKTPFPNKAHSEVPSRCEFEGDATEPVIGTWSALEKGSCCQGWPWSLCPGLETGQPRVTAGAAPASPLRSPHTLSPRNSHHQPQLPSPTCRHVCSPHQGLIRGAKARGPPGPGQKGTGRGHPCGTRQAGRLPRHAALGLCRPPCGPDSRGGRLGHQAGDRGRGLLRPPGHPWPHWAQGLLGLREKVAPGFVGTRRLPRVPRLGPARGHSGQA